MTDDVTLGEVARKVEELAARMDRGFARVDRRFDGLAVVHTDAYLADRRADNERHASTLARIERMEASQQWLVRTIVGIVLAAVAAGVIAAAGLPH